jgi:choline dehydrogenase-like flavoprotein
VHGLKKLKIIDASIIPTTIGINTCQTVYVIAEKERLSHC